MQPSPQDHLRKHARVRVADLARSLKVSAMSVSRALRGVGGVGEELRTRILAEAARLGYEPDPVLGALNAYRHASRPRKDLNNLAFLTAFPTEHGWKEMQFVVEQYEGALKGASRLGYRLAPFWLKQEGLSPARAAEVLYNRGTLGILIAPMPQGTRYSRISVDWSRFACVALGNSLQRPRFDRVAMDFHGCVQLACHHLRHLGYRRIGFGMSYNSDARHAHEFSDAFLGEQSRFPTTGPVPPFIWRRSDLVAAESWARTHRPDVLLTNRPGDFARMKEALPDSLRQNLKIFYTSIYGSDPPELEGVEEDLGEIGQRAVELLHAALLRGQKGVPIQPVTVKVPGRWRTPSV